MKSCIQGEWAAGRARIVPIMVTASTASGRKITANYYASEMPHPLEA